MSGAPCATRVRSLVTGSTHARCPGFAGAVFSAVVQLAWLLLLQLQPLLLLLLQLQSLRLLLLVVLLLLLP